MSSSFHYHSLKSIIRCMCSCSFRVAKHILADSIKSRKRKRNMKRKYIIQMLIFVQRMLSHHILWRHLGDDLTLVSLAEIKLFDGILLPNPIYQRVEWYCSTFKRTMQLCVNVRARAHQVRVMIVIKCTLNGRAHFERNGIRCHS